MRATSSQQLNDPAQRERAGAGARGPLIHVGTRCASIEEFVEKFARYAFEGALVLPATAELPIGTQGRFAIRLKDQSVAMRGRCRVTEVRLGQPRPEEDGTARAFLRVALLEMEEGSTSVHRRLLARHRAAVPSTIAPTASGPTLVSPPQSALVSPPGVATADSPPRARSRTNPLGIPRQVARRVSSAALEGRMPSAPFTLPANPLVALGADDPASFIDSILLQASEEERAEGRAGRPDIGRTPQPDRSTRAAPVEVTGPDTERAEVVAPSPLPLEGPTPPATRSRPVHRLVPYVLCAVLGLWIGRAGSGPRHQTGGAGQAAKVVAGAVAPRPASMESSDSSPKLYAPIEAAAQGAPAGCSARIITEPADAKIFWRGVLVGRSPIAEAKIPCGAGSFTVSHDRYETLTLPATLAPGAPFELDQRLHRPPAVLVVSSSPAGAGLTVNGHPFGSAPQRLDTWRYEQVTVRAALPGFLPWTKKLYLAQATTNLSIEMTAAGQPEASEGPAKR